MSESTVRTPVVPADVRWQGMQLLRECWKPVIVTMLLTNLLAIAAQIIMQLVPLAAEEAASLTSLMNDGEIPTANLVVGIAIQLIEAFIVLPILMQGLYKGLLSHLRGEKCSLHVMAGGLKRWKTAIALEFQITLRVLGYQLLGVIAVALLSFIPILGALGAAIGYVVLMYWVTLRYFDAKIHLADDAEHQLDSTDCIVYSLHDAEMYSISGLFKTIWPAFVPAIIGNLLTELLPASLALSVVVLALDALSAALQAVCCVAIYAHLRNEYQSDEKAAPVNEGLARARALAQGEPSS